MENQHTLENIEVILNQLQECASAYRQVAGCLENNELKSVLNSLARQRHENLDELEEDLRDMGLSLQADKTNEGHLFKTWENEDQAISSEEDERIIREILAAESHLLNKYEKALAGNGLPDYINERMEEHRKMISGAIRQLKEFSRIMV